MDVTKILLHNDKNIVYSVLKEISIYIYIYKTVLLYGFFIAQIRVLVTVKALNCYT